MPSRASCPTAAAGLRWCRPPLLRPRCDVHSLPPGLRLRPPGRGCDLHCSCFRGCLGRRVARSSPAPTSSLPATTVETGRSAGDGLSGCRSGAAGLTVDAATTCGAAAQRARSVAALDPAVPLAPARPPAPGAGACSTPAPAAWVPGPARRRRQGWRRSMVHRGSTMAGDVRRPGVLDRDAPSKTKPLPGDRRTCVRHDLWLSGPPPPVGTESTVAAGTESTATPWSGSADPTTSVVTIGTASGASSGVCAGSDTVKIDSGMPLTLVSAPDGFRPGDRIGIDRRIIHLQDPVEPEGPGHWHLGCRRCRRQVSPIGDDGADGVTVTAATDPAPRRHRQRPKGRQS